MVSTTRVSEHARLSCRSSIRARTDRYPIWITRVSLPLVGRENRVAPVYFLGSGASSSLSLFCSSIEKFHASVSESERPLLAAHVWMDWDVRRPQEWIAENSRCRRYTLSLSSHLRISPSSSSSFGIKLSCAELLHYSCDERGALSHVGCRTRLLL